MSYSALRIANYFIELSDFTITPIKVEKLVYIAHGYCLAITDELLIDEPILACRYGITIKSLYNTFKHFGCLEITELAIYQYREPNINKDYKNLLNRIWEVHGPLTQIQLANQTHAKKSPWAKVWSQHAMIHDLPYKIDNELIKAYYKEMCLTEKIKKEMP